MTGIEPGGVSWPPTVGVFPFDLSADELRRRGTAEIEAVRAELLRLANDPAPATIENLVAPLERAVARLRDANFQGSIMFSAHVDEATRTAGREVAEACERFWNQQLVDPKLHARLRSVDLVGEEESTQFAVQKMLRDMRRAGVEKLPDQRAELLATANEIERVSNQFAENIARLERAVLLDGPGRLAGLPPDYATAHAPGPDGKIRITTQYPDFLPIMAYCDDASVRRDLLFEFMNRAYPENEAVLSELLRLRAKFAKDLGYASWAAYALETKMVERPAAAREFLDRVAGTIRAAAIGELGQFLERKRKDFPEAERLEAWDSEVFLGGGYYDGKIRAERFGVDVRALRAYLPYVRVRDGLFDLCRELFGLRIEAVPSAPTWHATVEAFDVTRDGTHLGRFYLDVVPRKGKYGHAACFPVRQGLAGVSWPQSALLCNFLDPTVPLAEARMDWRDVVIFFHEFGHLLHALLAGRPVRLWNSPWNVEWDFVEAPSQLFEEWARDPATLNRFARDPDTGERIPAELLRRLHDADAFGRANRGLRQVAFSTISLDYYDRDPTGVDVAELFRTSWGKVYPRPQSATYHPETAFGHLTGYSAFYYTYLWSVVIARDLLTPFQARQSLTDPETARRYAEEILAPGSVRPAAELIRRFLGRDFNFDAFERWTLEGQPPPPAK